MNVQQSLEQLSYGSPNLRLEAIARLSQLNDSTVFKAIIRALKDPETQVRIAATRALVGFNNRQAVPELIGLLVDHNSSVRIAAVSALIHLGDPAAGPALFEMVKTAQTNKVTDAFQHQSIVIATRGLGYLGYSKAIPLLIKILRKGYQQEGVLDWQLQLRQAAALSLGQLETQEGVTTLLEVLNLDERPELWESVAVALSGLRTEDSFQKLIEALRVRFGERALQVWPRHYAIIRALSHTENTRAIPYLLPLVDSQIVEVRVALAYSLGLLSSREDGKQGQQALRKLLADALPQVRVEAIKAIANIGSDDLLGLLPMFTRDPDAMVANTAREVLEQSRQQTSVF